MKTNYNIWEMHCHLLQTSLILNSMIYDAKKERSLQQLILKTSSYNHFSQNLNVWKYIANISLPIQKKYQIEKMQHNNGCIYCKIQKGKYSLKQAAHLAYEQVVNNLRKHGYLPSKSLPNIWIYTHQEKPNFVYVSTILESNILIWMTSTTS